MKRRRTKTNTGGIRGKGVIFLLDSIKKEQKHIQRGRLDLTLSHHQERAKQWKETRRTCGMRAPHERLYPPPPTPLLMVTRPFFFVCPPLLGCPGTSASQAPFSQPSKGTTKNGQGVEFLHGQGYWDKEQPQVVDPCVGGPCVVVKDQFARACV